MVHFEFTIPRIIPSHLRARHVQLSRARPPVAPPVLQNGSFTCLVVPDSSVTDSPDETRDARRDARQELPSQEGSMTRVGLDNAGVPQRSGKTVTQRLEEKNGLQKTNRLLIDIGETLKYVGRVLVGTQNSLARVCMWLPCQVFNCNSLAGVQFLILWY